MADRCGQKVIGLLKIANSSKGPFADPCVF